jgi:prepilin-type N-terminal cleavage/methylation domain-containing protein
MRHREGITLIEVLVTIFIMGIGMLALLTLFPLGALNMAQALQNDRAVAAANVANDYALAMDVRHLAELTAGAAPLFRTPPGAGAPTLPANHPGPSYPVLIDPYGAFAGGGPVGGGIPALSPGIARIKPGYVPTLAAANRWFSLQDDTTFLDNGVPSQASGSLDRGGRYTWAYMVRRPQTTWGSVVELSIVVFAGRDTQLLSGEGTYKAAGSRASNNVTLSYAGDKPAVRKNGWLLDVSKDPRNSSVTTGNWYRVVNVADEVAGSVTVEVEPPLKNDLTVVAVMPGVIEVFDKGAGINP